MESTLPVDKGMRIILDIIDIIKQVKKGKADRNTIFREAVALGLGCDDTAHILQALQEREMLIQEDNVFTIVEKERQQVVKGLLNCLRPLTNLLLSLWMLQLK